MSCGPSEAVVTIDRFRPVNGCQRETIRSSDRLLTGASIPNAFWPSGPCDGRALNGQFLGGLRTRLFFRGGTGAALDGVFFFWRRRRRPAYAKAAFLCAPQGGRIAPFKPPWLLRWVTYACLPRAGVGSRQSRALQPVKPAEGGDLRGQSHAIALLGTCQKRTPFYC